MTQLSEEQQERVKQIERWMMLRTSAHSDPYVELARALNELRFLLSLLDSDSQAAAHRNYECMTTITDETLWCATCAARAEYVRGRSDAATAMRDKCVEKVKGLPTTTYDYRGNVPDSAEGFKQRAVTALESLTLDQVKPGEM